MVQKEEFEAEIQAANARYAPPDNLIVAQWYVNNGHKLDGTGAKVLPFIWKYLLKDLIMKRKGSRLPRSKLFVPKKMVYI
eukprot:12536253-Ditylum_brightwellii.AAC.1